ncbi:hypothetical protein [Lapidilactobacillus bayanensis]|uniref:hypothetical protein n=1 Tax=Lapidilactobacillus bayanensis TaxID=2485998 RepID=UPI000F7950FA|nr:hypothetical protein [Lapidilactobacillus bayanensis]
METIIMSFQPQVFPALCSGIKGFEYRPRFPENQVIVYLYLSAPIKAIVGRMLVSERLELSQLTTQLAGNEQGIIRIQQHEAEGARFAIPIEKIEIFAETVSLIQAKEITGRFFAPQSYCYLKQTNPLFKLLKLRPIQKEIVIDPVVRQKYLGYFCDEIYQLPNFTDNTSALLGTHILSI